jgi:2-polyprenyl-3-methyl-5-hydroxy-6-metoxy-1,4-benzoquinol methylase
MSEYDQQYGQVPNYFGSEPSPLLERFVDRIPAGSKVLDIGVGQGRHAIYLARQDHSVVGIDTSQVAIETVRQIATHENLPVELWHGSFLDYLPDESFGAVLCFGLLQTLPRTLGASLLHRMREWTQPGGIVFLTAWHVDDPSYNRIDETWDRVSRHSFRSSDGEYRTFLARSEILDLMIGWRLIHHWEGLGPEHRHGDNPPEQHGVVEIVAVSPS